MGRPPRLLVVCTANICRSPMAEVLLASHLEDIDVAAIVRSCGHLEAGVRVSPHSVTVMAERGLDISEHRSQTNTRRFTSGADLIITMSKENVRQVMEVDMDAWPRTFPLKPLVRRAIEIGRRRTDEPFAAWVERLHEGRRPIDMLADDPDDDIADPMGKPLRDYRSAAELMSGLLDQLVAFAFPVGSSELIRQ